jgi:predicted aldo/keto reductase-like oxidoreductase
LIRRLGFREGAKRSYSLIGTTPKVPGENAAACVECGECLEKCPQGIEIIDQLKKAYEVLSENQLNSEVHKSGEW